MLSQSIRIDEKHEGKKSHNQHKRSYNVVFCGEPGSGKSTLIANLVEYEGKIPKVLESQQFAIPTTSKVMNLIDTDSNLEKDELMKSQEERTEEKMKKKQKGKDKELEEEKKIKSAGKKVINTDKIDLFIYVMDVTQEGKEEKLIEWVNMFKKYNKPIYIVKTKGKKAGQTTNKEDSNPTKDAQRALQHLIKQTVGNYPYYLGSFHYYGVNANELVSLTFQLATHLLYPISPLIEEDGLTEEAQRVLKRIFWLLDDDCDGILNDEEQAHFVEKMCNETYQYTSLKTSSLKQRIEKMTTGTQGIQLVQFYNLHERLIRAGYSASVWNLFHSYHITQNLTLDSTLYNNSYPVPNEKQMLILSQTGIRLFMDLFRQFDADEDGKLSEQEYQDAFSLIQFKKHTLKSLWGTVTLESDDSDDSFGVQMPLESWISLWSFLLNQHPIYVASSLAHWGITDPMTLHDAFQLVTAPQYRESDEQVNFYNVYIFGATGCGKSTFRTRLVHDLSKLKSEKLRDVASKGQFIPDVLLREPFGAVSVIEVHSENSPALCRIVLRECHDTQVLRDASLMEICDACLMVFDGSDQYSFSMLPSIQKQLDKRIPTPYFQTHAELDDVHQEYEISPSEFWSMLTLPEVPTFFSIEDGTTQIDDLKSGLLAVCEYPELCRPNWSFTEDTQENEVRQRRKKMVHNLLSVAFLASLTSIATFFSLKLFKKYRRSPTS